MSILKKGLTLSIIGITIFVLAFSTWNTLRLDALASGQDWSKAYTLQYDNNGDVIIDYNDYNFIEQGAGIVESVYQPIESIFNTLEQVGNVLRKFFGIDNLPNQLDIQQENDTLYHDLKDVYLLGNWDSYTYEDLQTYYFDIDSEFRLIYYEWSHSYELKTYQVVFGIRLWSISTVQITYEQLDLYNDQYAWK